MKGLKVILLSCVTIYSFTPLTRTQIASADIPISDCINSLLYSSDSLEELKRTEINEQTVISVCKGITTQAEASSVKNCVESLLYRRDNHNGIVRNQTSEETAISVCAISRNTPIDTPTLANDTIPNLATHNSNSCLISIGVLIPNEKAIPEPKPMLTNPIESRLMAMTKAEDLVRELNSVRSNYQKWINDLRAMKTQTRLAQIIHFRSQQIGSCLN